MQDQTIPAVATALTLCDDGQRPEHAGGAA